MSGAFCWREFRCIFSPNQLGLACFLRHVHCTLTGIDCFSAAFYVCVVIFRRIRDQLNGVFLVQFVTSQSPAASVESNVQGVKIGHMPRVQMCLLMIIISYAMSHPLFGTVLIVLLLCMSYHLLSVVYLTQFILLIAIPAILTHVRLTQDLCYASA